MARFGEGTARAEQDLREGMSDVAAAIVLDVDDTQNPPLVKLNIGGGESWMPYIGPRPWEQERVLVAYLAKKPVCIGAFYGHALGTVVSTTAGLATITGDDGFTYIYPYREGDTLTSGHRVVMDHALRTVLHRLSAEPAGSEYVPPPPPPPSSGGGAWVFYPAWSAHYRGGAYQNAYVTISTTRQGYYGYGTQLADTIPDGATITKLDLVLRQNWDQVPGVDSLMGLHTNSSRSAPGGDPGLSGTYGVAGGSRTVSLLGAVGDALKTGAAFGIGFYSGSNGYREYDHAGTSGQIIAEWA